MAFPIEFDDPDTERATTLEWIGKRANAMGVTRLANITGLDIVGIPVFVAVRPSSRSLSVAQGKGETFWQAKISALMEAAEGYHAERIEQPIVLASRAELNDSCLVADITQFPTAEGFSPQPNRQIFWIRGWELIAEQEVWIPYDLVSTAYTVEMTENYSGLYATTTGLAAGKSIGDAIDHGLREVIERDATLLHLLSTRPAQDRNRILVDSISSQGAIKLLRKFQKSGIFVAVWEVTSDVGIPCFYSVIADQPYQQIGNCFFAAGSGCDLDKDRALVASLLEAAQSRLTVISGAREDLSRDWYSTKMHHEFVQRYDALNSATGQRKFSDITSHCAFSPEDRLQLMVAKLISRGFRQVIVVNLSRSDLQIPVVKVIVPGMEVALDEEGSRSGASMTRRSRQM